MRQHLPALRGRGHARRPTQVAALGIKVPVERRERLEVRWGEGCVECRHTGLYGRTGVFEMLDVGRRVRALINEGSDANEIDARRARRGHGDAARGGDAQARRRRHHLRRGRARHGGRASEPRSADGRASCGLLRARGLARWSRSRRFEEERALRAARARRRAARAHARHLVVAAGLGGDGDGRRLARRRAARARAHRGAARCSRCSTRTAGSTTRSRVRRLRDLLPRSAQRKQCVVLVGPAVRSAGRARARGGPRRAAAARPPTSCARLFERVLEQRRGDAAPSREVLDECVRAALGLTGGEAVRVLRKACARGGRARRAARSREIVREKRRALHRTPALTFHDAGDGLADVGGLGELKRWLARAPARLRRRGASRSGCRRRAACCCSACRAAASRCRRKAVAREWQLPAAAPRPRGRVRRPRAQPRGRAARGDRGRRVARAGRALDRRDREGLRGRRLATRRRAACSAAFLTWLVGEARAGVRGGDRERRDGAAARAAAPRPLRRAVLRRPADARPSASRSSRIHLRKRGRDPLQFDARRARARGRAALGRRARAGGGARRSTRRSRERASSPSNDLANAIEETVPLYDTYEERIKELRDWARTRARPATLDARMVDLFGQRS